MAAPSAALRRAAEVLRSGMAAAAADAHDTDRAWTLRYAMDEVLVMSDVAMPVPAPAVPVVVQGEQQLHARTPH